MKKQFNVTERLINGDAEYLAKLFDKAERILIKKLSNNDRDWARFPNKHQAGVYIPHEHRDGGFFSPLKTKKRLNPDHHEIRETFFRTFWLQFNGAEKETRLVHYTSKGQETHMTRLPKEAFADLLPASYLVMGRFRVQGEFAYECLTIDSGSEEANFLRDLFDLEPDFIIDEFIPEKVKAAEQERVLDFADQVIEAWFAGKISQFASENAAMPPTAALAQMALEKFLNENGLNTIDPFTLDTPGDVLREISRNIEWNLFREYQKRERSVELIRMIVGDKPRDFRVKDIIRQLIDKLPEIDAIMLSASQQRKSRAGYSYEHHIEAILRGGGVPFQKQVVIESKKRPDFVLPSLRFLKRKGNGSETAMILSAKTTLKERWKQVEREMKGHRLFLTTVDENIASNAIQDMKSIGIQLVVPESLMRRSKDTSTEYTDHDNVISFKTFCELHIKPHLKNWKTGKG
jgi:hypothetical protein